MTEYSDYIGSSWTITKPDDEPTLETLRRMLESNNNYIDQLRWERNLAISQLRALGYSLGEKIRVDKDTISRREAIAEAKTLFKMGEHYCDECSIIGMLNSLPSVAPKMVTCKECDYWLKDTHQCGLQICAVMYEDDFCSRGECNE